MVVVEPKELSFLQNDPGAVKHGNFINYYAFHSVQSRLDRIDYQMFPKPKLGNIVVLDVGCNSGDLTSALYNYLQTRYEESTINILAMDIDPMLITRACEINKQTTIEFVEGNIMDDNGKTIIQQYLQKHGKKCFDFIFCFSVTMWIHLNNGDDGLLDFIKYIQSISISLIIEPQPWKCYLSAQKRLKKAGSAFEKYQSLKIRKNVDETIEHTILEGNFTKTFESAASSWDRKLQCYHIKDDNTGGSIK